jgi:guanine deaminase
MLRAFRGEILHFINDPAITQTIEQSYQYFADGILLVESGKIKALGSTETILKQLADDNLTATIVEYPNSLIMPGFIDTHVHYPQTDMIASYGEQLMTWLEQYTFPEESKFSEYDHAFDVANFFLEQLIAAGTTTALVFGTVHSESVDAFFTAAQQRNLRMICGKVLMDQNCPENLQDTAESGYQDSKKLINKWHNVDRLHYAITPRFAPTCSDKQLHLAGKLLAEYDDVYLHTHLCENKQEIALVQQLFPQSDGYLDVYHQHQLLGKRSVFAHGVHLTEQESNLLATTDSAIAFCPTSNLFLGSGCFDLSKAEKHNINVGLGTDIGAGTSFSMLTTLNEAYKTQQLQGQSLNPFKAFYLATLGGAKALHLEDKIGSFVLNNDADFIVLDYQGTELMQRRISHCKTLAERLFVLSMLGDDRHIKATYIMGKKYSQMSN